MFKPTISLTTLFLTFDHVTGVEEKAQGSGAGSGDGRRSQTVGILRHRTTFESDMRNYQISRYVLLKLINLGYFTRRTKG